MSLLDAKLEDAARTLAGSQDEVLQTAGLLALMRLKTLEKRLKGEETRGQPLSQLEDISRQPKQIESSTLQSNLAIQSSHVGNTDNFAITPVNNKCQREPPEQNRLTQFHDFFTPRSPITYQRTFEQANLSAISKYSPSFAATAKSTGHCNCKSTFCADRRCGCRKGGLSCGPSCYCKGGPDCNNN